MRLVLTVASAAAVLMLVACSGTGASAEPDPDDIRAAQALFDRIEQRWGGSSGDLVSGGPCPLGDAAGELLIETGFVGCVVEGPLRLTAVSSQLLSESFEDEIARGDVIAQTADDGSVNWVLFSHPAGTQIIVEHKVAGLAVLASKPLASGESDVETAREMTAALQASAGRLIGELASADLVQMIRDADYVDN